MSRKNSVLLVNAMDRHLSVIKEVDEPSSRPVSQFSDVTLTDGWSEHGGNRDTLFLIGELESLTAQLKDFPTPLIPGQMREGVKCKNVSGDTPGCGQADEVDVSSIEYDSDSETFYSFNNTSQPSVASDRTKVNPESSPRSQFKLKLKDVPLNYPTSFITSYAEVDNVSTHPKLSNILGLTRQTRIQQTCSSPLDDWEFISTPDPLPSATPSTPSKLRKSSPDSKSLSSSKSKRSTHPYSSNHSQSSPYLPSDISKPLPPLLPHPSDFKKIFSCRKSSLPDSSQAPGKSSYKLGAGIAGGSMNMKKTKKKVQVPEVLKKPKKVYGPCQSFLDMDSSSDEDVRHR